MQDSVPDWSGVAALAGLFATEENLQGLWTAAELHQLLQHQLDARLPDSLADALPLDQARLLTLCAAAVPRITTLRELFAHPAPGLELLELVKKHAKLCRSNAESTLPENLASAIYYAAIAVALLRHKTRMTQLDDVAIAGGLDWVASREWMDAGIKGVALAARGKVA
jgi:hypothetical protein